MANDHATPSAVRNQVPTNAVVSPMDNAENTASLKGLSQEACFEHPHREVSKKRSFKRWPTLDGQTRNLITRKFFNHMIG
jgi:hypothetical protein